MSSTKTTTKTKQVLATCANCKTKPVFHHLFDVCAECLKDCQKKMANMRGPAPFRLICAWCGVFPVEENKEGEYEDACVFCELKDRFDSRTGEGDASIKEIRRRTCGSCDHEIRFCTCD
jgi:hypothetical protein